MSNIPKSFKLFNQTITVHYDSEMLLKDDNFGLCSYRQNKIFLQPSSETTPITKEQLEQTFYHELVHMLLYHGGEDDYSPALHKKEYLVDRIGQLLHQALSTAEFD